jgi:hypothetical protein
MSGRDPAAFHSGAGHDWVRCRYGPAEAAAQSPHHNHRGGLTNYYRAGDLDLIHPQPLLVQGKAESTRIDIAARVWRRWLWFAARANLAYDEAVRDFTAEEHQIAEANIDKAAAKVETIKALVDQQTVVILWSVKLSLFSYSYWIRLLAPRYTLILSPGWRASRALDHVRAGIPKMEI